MNLLIISSSSLEIMQRTKLQSINVYCPEWPPGGTIGHPGGQQKKFLPFGHGRDLVAFNGTGVGADSVPPQILSPRT